ncbi:phosphatidylcholine synthase [Legionella adelaidensis]|uniref:phosphatidylcholine synthase n=1 Tax=Legionella adelaidensis TaxID=45056 RepID=UPI001041577C|nr:CDP-alcohol phosphatidyltransferase family protein [Legionella adelaidensis]
MKKKNYHPLHYLLAWAVHIFTASASFFGVYSLYEIYHHQYIAAFWLMGITVFIDAIDGTLARLVKVKEILPKFDGALLDNIVDFLNYVVTPAFFLLVKEDMLPPGLEIVIILGITITSSYQFCQEDAKTPDHFFKGFPCYWNFAIFYMFIFNTSMVTNAWILSVLCVLIFVPVKYVYPSRLDYLTQSKRLKLLMHLCSLLFGISSALILWTYPEQHPALLAISLGYVIMYLILSIYRTYSPMLIAKINAIKD